MMDDIHICESCERELERCEDEDGVIWQCVGLDCLQSYAEDELGPAQ